MTSIIDILDLFGPFDQSYEPSGDGFAGDILSPANLWAPFSASEELPAEVVARDDLVTFAVERILKALRLPDGSRVFDDVAVGTGPEQAARSSSAPSTHQCHGWTDCQVGSQSGTT